MSALEALNNASQRYAPISEIGRGAFSVVVSATDRVTNKKVAIKRISHVFDDAVFAKHVLREIKLLRHLKHPNVISMQDIILEPANSSHAGQKWIPDPKLSAVPAIGSSVTPEQRIYFVSEQLDTDLHAVIQSPQPLSVKHFQFFMYQLLQGVAYLHRAHILHRDLKPENILVNRDCHLKVCDLGLARLDKHAHYLDKWSPFSPSSPSTPDLTNSPQSSSSISDLGDDELAMTERVVTRWYRAPEVILSMGKYSSGLDMWSVACIFAELAGRRPLFPGKDFMEQLHLISGVLGKPTEYEIMFFESPKAREFLRALPEKKPTPLGTLFPSLDPHGLDLLSKMLVFDPRKRLSAEEALRHPFFSALFRPEDGIAAPSLQHMQQTFSFEQNSRLDLPSLRDMILQEMRELLLPATSQVQPMQATPTPAASDTRKTKAEGVSTVTRPSEGLTKDKKSEGSEMDGPRRSHSLPQRTLPLSQTAAMDYEVPV